MSLAEKMYVTGAKQVPCVNLAPDVDLGDIIPWGVDLKKARGFVQEGKSPALFVFVENSAQLEQLTADLAKLWQEGLAFWIFYPKKPHLGTDLGRDQTWKIMQQAGMKGTRQVGVDQLWSCLYFKPKG